MPGNSRPASFPHAQENLEGRETDGPRASKVRGTLFGEIRGQAGLPGCGRRVTRPSARKNNGTEIPIFHPWNRKSAVQRGRRRMSAVSVIGERERFREGLRSQSTSLCPCYFLRRHEGEMANPGLRFRRVGFRKGNDRRTWGWRRLEPPAVVQETPWQPRSPNGEGDDFRHGPTMPG